MSSRRGLFVVVDGPSGIGKTTMVEHVRAELVASSIPVFATREPSESPLGRLARHNTDDYRGLALACLVAADRYLHLEHDIRPALRDGKVVVCDRYVPTSLVLQRMDGVDPGFLVSLNQHADPPDLTIILTGDARRSERRSGDRSRDGRFHRHGRAARVIEDRLYREVVHQLRAAGSDVVHHEVVDEPSEAVAAVVLAAVRERLAGLQVDEAARIKES